MTENNALLAAFPAVGVSGSGLLQFVGILYDMGNIYKIFPTPPYNDAMKPLFCLTFGALSCILCTAWHVLAWDGIEMHKGSGMFVGQAKHTVNKDGRVSIPSKMRDVIKKRYDTDDLYLVLLSSNIICLYPAEGFETLTASMSDPQGGATLDQILEMERICAFAEPCKLDGSGRIVIPAEMRQDAGINQDALVVGAKSHIEIWDPKHWEWSRKQARAGSGNIRTWPLQPGVGQQST